MRQGQRIFVGHMFNFNLQFAEMPVDRTPLLVSQGHAPLMDVLEAHPGVKADFFFTGYTDMWLAENAPTLVRRVKAGLSRRQFGLGTYTYAHPILSLLPREDVMRQLAKGLACDEKVWGIRPHGLLLPEVAWDMTLPLAMKELGIEWVAVYREMIAAIASKPAYPGVVWAAGAAGSRAKAVLGDRTISKAVQQALRGEILVSRIAEMILHGAVSSSAQESPPPQATLACESPGTCSACDAADVRGNANGTHGAHDAYSSHDLFILLKQDAEVLYFATMARHMADGSLTWGDELPAVEAAERFDAVLSEIERIPGVEFVTIEEFLATHSPDQLMFPECISGHADMDKWTRGEGRERLNVLTDAARDEIRAASYAVELAASLAQAQAQVQARAASGGVSVVPAANVERARSLLEEAWDALLLAENSDGRAFIPHPTRKLAVATAAVRAAELARDSVKALTVSRR
ncbi:MAG: hypothetical protein ACM309_09180 [Bacillota bacterium]